MPKKSKRRASRQALTRKAKKLWADRIKREGICLFVGKKVGRKQHVCKGYLQAMHCFGKKAYPAVRFELWNGVPGCAAAHTYYTYHPVEWTHWLMEYWGEEVYWAYYGQAEGIAKVDLEATIAALEAEKSV